MNNKKKKGFTLIELVIVIAIIGILAAIAIPKYNASRKAAANTAHNSNVQILKSAGQLKQLETKENVTWPTAEGKDELKYLDKWPEVPAGSDVEGKTYTVTITPTHVKVEPEEIVIKK